MERLGRAVGACCLVALVIGLPCSWGPVGAQEQADGGSLPVCSAQDRGTATLAKGERTHITFGRKRTRRKLDLDFTISGCRFADDAIGTELRGRALSFMDGGDEELEVEQLAPTITVEAPDSITFALRVDPVTKARPGSYTGTVTIDDPVLQPVRVPVTTTLQYSQWQILMISIFVPGVLGASVVVWFKARKAGASDSYPHWWRKAGNWIAAAAGVLAGIVAWHKGFLADPDFGTELHDNPIVSWVFVAPEWLALCTAIVTAITGAVTAASLAGDQVRDGADKPLEA